MSENKFSIMHVLGLGISVFSLLMGVVQLCTPSKTNFSSLASQPSMMPQSTVSVIAPEHYQTLMDFNWTDSFPFNWDALAAANVRSIDIDQYELPRGDDTVRANMKLGAELGEHSRILNYSVDPERKKVSRFLSKKLGNSSGQAFESQSLSYRDGGSANSADFTIYASVQGATSNRDGHWLLQGDGRPSRLDFDAEGKLFFQYEAESEACLNLLGKKRLTVHFLDAKLKPAKMQSEALRIKRQLLAIAGQHAQMPVEIICTRGPKLQPNLRLELDSREMLIGKWVNDYDSLGRPLFFQRTDGHSEAVTESMTFHYAAGSGNLLGWEHDRGAEIDHVSIEYTQRGWPEKMIQWVDFKDGRIKILSRSFFDFLRPLTR